MGLQIRVVRHVCEGARENLPTLRIYVTMPDTLSFIAQGTWRGLQVAIKRVIFQVGML